MSISGIGGSSVSGLFSDQLSQMNQRKHPEDFNSTEDFVESILSDQDSDGDGLLSSSEANFKEDHFNKIDSDSDGYLSQEELVADVEKMQEMKAAMGSMSVAMGGGKASSGSSESSSSDESEEEYDEFDYNKDGVVTLDEMQQAFASGETSLEDIVGRRGDMNQQSTNEEGRSGQSLMQRMAMRAYQDQSANYSSASLLGSSV